MLKVFTVYDSKAETYAQPFFSSTTGQAIRSFQDAVEQPDHIFNKHAADFTLFEIGVYDDATGALHSLEAKVNLGTALDYIPKIDAPKIAGVK